MRQCAYFLRRSDGDGPIKIGCSKNPHLRAKAIGRSLGVDLCVEAVLDAGWIAENTLHLELSEFRMPSPGREWFKPSAKVLGVLSVAKETGSYEKVRAFMAGYSKDAAA